MSCADVGLLLNFMGAVLLCLTSQFDIGVGWGGKQVWKEKYYRWLNLVGWILLIFGFLIQFKPFMNFLHLTICLTSSAYS